MFNLMLALGGAGLALLLLAPALARLLMRGRGDPTGLTRILQAVAVVLLVAAVLARPHSTETSAFPPSPDEAESVGR